MVYTERSLDGERHPSPSSLSHGDLMALVSDVAPLLSKERANEPGGLWATKQYGDLKVRPNLDLVLMSHVPSGSHVLG